MKTKLFVMAASLMLGGSFIASAQSTRTLSATKANDYGVVYTLPKTVLDITIETETTEKQPGEFYKYAKKYLNIDNPIATPQISTTVKSVTVTERGVADESRRYNMQLKGGFSPFIVINNENIPLSINTSDLYNEGDTPELPVARKADPTPLQTEAARQVVSEEMLRSRSVAKRAELAAAQIYALRQSRTDLITGQSDNMPPDGKAMQIVMDNIEAQEAALMAMFVGTTKVWTEVKTVVYTPEDNVSDQVIARVSATDGLVDADDLSGAPLTISVKITERGHMPENDKGETIPFPKNGVAYCIPGKADIKIKYDGKELFNQRLPFAQFGVDYGMDPSAFTNKKTPVGIKLNGSTGAIMETVPAQM